jgi:hypothetical protein
MSSRSTGQSTTSARTGGWLVAFRWELQTVHASPHGPIAFALLIIAAIGLWLSRRRPGYRI